MQTDGIPCFVPLLLHTNWGNKKEFDSVADTQDPGRSTPNCLFTCSYRNDFRGSTSSLCVSLQMKG